MGPAGSERCRASQRAAGDESAARTELARRFLVALLGAAGSTRRFLERATGEHGLTLQQYNVLRILRGAAPDPLPTMTIAERMLERTPGITRFLDHLEGRGLVKRERSPDDRRTVHARITDAGLDLLARMDDDVDRADRVLIENLPAPDVESATGVLRRVERKVR